MVGIGSLRESNFTLFCSFCREVEEKNNVGGGVMLYTFCAAGFFVLQVVVPSRQIVDSAQGVFEML